MKTCKVIRKKVKDYEYNRLSFSIDVYEKEVNEYLVVLTEKEYCKAKRIFKEN